MKTMQHLRTFKTKRFTIQARAVEDFDLDLSFDDTGEIRRDLERGELCSFGVIVTACLDGHKLAEDSLWACIYKRPDDFMDHKECGEQNRKLRESGDRARCGSYFSDMVRSVCRDARKAVATLKTVSVRQPVNP